MTKKNLLNKSIVIDSLFEDNSDFNKILSEPLDNRNVLFTAYGRNALYLGMAEILNLTKKRNILVPSYNCGDELSAILASGFKIIPYSINKKLTTDLESLEKLINENTAGILFTHYFGFPFYGLEKLLELKKKYGLFLIEDCAHSLGSKLNGQSLGTFGDIAIFSLRKFFPIPHGGALVINNSNIRLPKPQPMPSEALDKDLAVYFGFRSGILTPGEFLSNQVNNQNKHGPRLAEFGGYKLGMSNFVRFLLGNLNLELENRASNFQYYLDFFSKNNKVVPLINNITDGTEPLFFPLIVEDSEESYHKLLEFDEIFTQPFWSDLHNLINWSEHKDAEWLKKSLLVLPVDKKVEDYLLEKLFEL